MPSSTLQYPTLLYSTIQYPLLLPSIPSSPKYPAIPPIFPSTPLCTPVQPSITQYPPVPSRTSSNQHYHAVPCSAPQYPTVPSCTQQYSVDMGITNWQGCHQNFFRFMGRFPKNAKKNISDTPRLSTSITKSPNLCCNLQLSYREIFIFQKSKENI